MIVSDGEFTRCENESGEMEGRREKEQGTNMQEGEKARLHCEKLRQKHHFLADRGARSRGRAHLLQDPVKPLERLVQMKFNPAGCAGNGLPTVKKGFEYGR